MIRAMLALLLAAAPTAALAQAQSCTIPGALPRPLPDLPRDSDPARRTLTTSYVLAVTWTPQYCRDHPDEVSSRFQCGGGNRFGFTLHGLWPEGTGTEWPQYCAAAPLLTPDVLRRNLCATPSVQLLQHEYARHGTCMSVTPAAYFARSTALYAKLRYPDMDGLSRASLLRVAAFAEEFAAANPGMRPDMLRILPNGNGWLSEVWICLDRQFAYTRCPLNPWHAKPEAPLKVWRADP